MVKSILPLFAISQSVASVTTSEITIAAGSISVNVCSIGHWFASLSVIVNVFVAFEEALIEDSNFYLYQGYCLKSLLLALS